MLLQQQEQQQQQQVVDVSFGGNPLSFFGRKTLSFPCLHDRQGRELPKAILMKLVSCVQEGDVSEADSDVISEMCIETACVTDNIPQKQRFTAISFLAT